MTPTDFLWVLAPLVTGAAGWMACERFSRRKISLLQDQIQAARLTAQERATQARQQIGQLQAELAARPPLAPAVREQRDQLAFAAAAAAATAAATAAAAAASLDRRAALNKQLDGDGFAATDALRHGFASTEVMD